MLAGKRRLEPNSCSRLCFRLGTSTPTMGLRSVAWPHWWMTKQRARRLKAITKGASPASSCVSDVIREKWGFDPVNNQDYFTSMTHRGRPKMDLEQLMVRLFAGQKERIDAASGRTGARNSFERPSRQNCSGSKLAGRIRNLVSVQPSNNATENDPQLHQFADGAARRVVSDPSLRLGRTKFETSGESSMERT